MYTGIRYTVVEVWPLQQLRDYEKKSDKSCSPKFLNEPIRQHWSSQYSRQPVSVHYSLEAATFPDLWSVRILTDSIQSQPTCQATKQLIHTVSQKNTWFFIIMRANVDHFSTLFCWQILKEIFYIPNVDFPLALNAVPCEIWKLKIQLIPTASCMRHARIHIGRHGAPNHTNLNRVDYKTCEKCSRNQNISNVRICSKVSTIVLLSI